MRNLLFALIAVGSLFGASVAASARHRQLRRGGVVDEVRVLKDDEGNATVVMITADFGRGSPTTNVFFPSLVECELGKKLAEAGGFLPDFESLR
jgi:hypothetical protein